MNPHRGLLHHQIITVRNVARSSPFYGAMFRYFGYELAASHSGPDHAYEDWKPWRLDSPHEISISQADSALAAVPHQRGAPGHHHHIAFCAEDRADVDRFHTEVLVPLARQGLCTIEDPPVDCPEYGEGYYATFFLDPDGLKYEFVFNPNYLRAKAARDPAFGRSNSPQRHQGTKTEVEPRNTRLSRNRTTLMSAWTMSDHQCPLVVINSFRFRIHPWFKPVWV